MPYSPVQGQNIRLKLLIGIGKLKFEIYAVPPTGIGIVRVSGAQNQHPSRFQRTGGGIDKLGGPVTGQDPVRV